MVSGQRAFQGDSAIETMHAILNSEPPEWRAGVELPPTLDRIIRRCLAKRPADRFQSAGDLSFALESALSPSSTRNGPAIQDGAGVRRPPRFAALPMVAISTSGTRRATKPRSMSSGVDGSVTVGMADQVTLSTGALGSRCDDDRPMRREIRARRPRGPYDPAVISPGGAERSSIVTTANQRACIDCGTRSAALPIVDETGTFGGWICHDCDHRRRQRRHSWHRRLRRRLRA